MRWKPEHGDAGVAVGDCRGSSTSSRVPCSTRCFCCVVMFLLLLLRPLNVPLDAGWWTGAGKEGTASCAEAMKSTR
jgi:hypothetical protein